MKYQQRIFLDEQTVIDCYKKFDSVKPVAATFGVSMQTIYRLLISNGIPRTKNRAKEKHPRQWTHKYCPALVGIAYYVDGITSRTEIAKATGIDKSSVNAILVRKFGVEKKHIKKRVYERDVDIELIERDYLNGATTFELEAKYGVQHATLSRWMIRRGHRRQRITMPEEKRICAHCGNEFLTTSSNAKYCSKRCAQRDNKNYGSTSDHRHRARKYGTEYERGITLKKVFERDNGVCKLCGGICDYNDKKGHSLGKSYPTLDHIIPLSRGGSHTWENVQLAHHYCNSFKRDRLLEEIKEQVVLHAKEQGIADKCA